MSAPAPPWSTGAATGAAGPQRRRTGAPRPRRAGALLVLAVVAWAAWGSGLGREPVLNPGGRHVLGEFWVAALHPELSPELLRTTARACVVTVAFALLGTVLATAGGLVGGVLASRVLWSTTPFDAPARRVRRRAGWLLTRGALGVPRGVHEAVWGVVLVSFLGRDPLVGVLAIAVPFGAITATVYADLIDTTARAQHAALVAAGAGRLTALVYGVLPLTVRDLTAYAFYRFDCALRSAVVLGMIGAGGVGLELNLAFQALDHERTWTLLYALVVLGALVDRWGAALRSGRGRRRVPASAALAAVLALASAVVLSPDLGRLTDPRTAELLGDLVRRAVPPDPPGGWTGLLGDAAATLRLSVLAIAVSSVLAPVLAFAAARAPGAGPLRRAVGSAARLALLVVRVVSPPVWALLLLFVLLPGPLPGALALGVYNAGVLGRLFAEVVEDLDDAPAAALRAAGAGAVATSCYAVLPLALTRFAAYALYRWEVAIRDSVVVGVVGAGGLGRVLESERASFDHAGVLAVVLALLVLSVLVDLLSARARRALG
ncbi:PhnE/PtxC family ABC transporter permease [Kineococcus gypseus]|uniref:PhnE/PtxC family ABC transporter permease n=1 Tax=Kineococcus gypseus TaxID=1637102 RepID=UPI003D7E8EFE